MQCPVCEISLGEPSQLCRCGYDVSKNGMIDTEVLKSFYSHLKNNCHYTEYIKFIKRLHEFKQSIKGKTSTGKRGGWRYEDTANLIGEQKSTISVSIGLATALDDYPDLTNCKNKKQALETKAFLETGIKLFDSEKDLQNHLENNWNKTPFEKYYELRGSYINAGDAGEIDLLAYHNKIWVIFELKKNKTSDNTIGQLLRYMGWFKANRAGIDERVEGVIISGYPPDKSLLYSVSCISEIVHLWSYFCLGANTVFLNPEETNDMLTVSFDAFIDELIKFRSR